MFRIKSLLIGLGCYWLVATSLCAQVSTNFFMLTIKPPANTIMIEETTNLLTVAIGNLAITNVTVDPDPTGGTNNVTNTVITILWTNVTVNAIYNGGTVKLLDNGTAPDKTRGDGLYSGNFIPPAVTNLSNFVFNFQVKGDDFAFTNDAGEQQIINVTSNTPITYRVVPRPRNDKFTNAFKVLPEGATITTATNNYASMQAGEPVHAGVATVDASVWWKWSSPVTTNVLIDTAGSSFNPVLAVYTGVDISNLVEVASSVDDTANKLKAHVNFDAIAGTTYRIAVAGQNTNGVGNIRLRIEPGAVPDTSGPGALITTPPDNSLFTTNLVSFAGTAGELGPKQSGVFKVMLKVNSAAPVTATNTENWTAKLDLPPGTNTVQVFAIDYAGNTGQVNSIIVKYVNPTNDFFADSFLLPGSSGFLAAINGRATREPGEPIHAGNEGGHSIWYRWVPPVDGNLFLTTTNSNFDTILAIYTGDTLTNLTALASNDDATQGSLYSELTTFVYGGTTYYIVVDGYGGLFGRVELRYTLTPQPPTGFFNLNVQASPGGHVVPGSGNYPADSVLTLRATPDTNFAFIRWEGSVISAENPLNVVMNGNKSLLARFAFTKYLDTFETGNLSALPWSTSGDQPWFVQSTEVGDGQFSARSGVIGPNQTSSLKLVMNTLAGSGSFLMRVSSEEGWDSLEFYLNDKKIKQWSGAVSWRNYLFTVPAGTNSFEWRYGKDANFSAGLDAAFIDNLYLPMVEPSKHPAQLSISTGANGVAVVQVTGSPFQSYVLEGSTNLVSWTALSTNKSFNGQFEYIDSQSTNYPMRNYRALTP